jgi:glycosyltransferase involved in cell wall biosynthesis
VSASAAPRPRIAAVIPTHERADLVVRALGSVLAQSRPPDEIVVVDDGSTDDTAARVGAIPGVRLVRQANAGAAAARNRGVREAGGDWIAFLDADDLWTPGHLARVERAILATEGRAPLLFADAAYGTGPDAPTLWGRSGFRVDGERALAVDASNWGLLSRQPMLMPATVVRRDAFLACGGLDERLPCREDTHLFLKLALAAPACAVAGVGVVVTADADPGERLTERHPSTGAVYWRCSVDLFEDALRRAAGHPRRVRRALRSQLAVARWRTFRLARSEGSGGLGPLVGALRADPLLPARLGLGRLIARRTRGAPVRRAAAQEGAGS